MITNRRIYEFHLAKIGSGIALLPDLLQKTREITGREFRVMNCLYGPVSVVVFDMRYPSEEALHEFSSNWYPMLYQENFIALWFANVKQMASELWWLVDIETPSLNTETSRKVDDYWGAITYRLALQPYASCYDEAMNAAKSIKAKTEDQFQTELILSQCSMGASNKISLEMDFANVNEQQRFTKEWMKWLKEEKLFETLFENLQAGTSEVWETVP